MVYWVKGAATNSPSVMWWRDAGVIGGGGVIGVPLGEAFLEAPTGGWDLAESSISEDLHP